MVDEDEKISTDDEIHKLSSAIKDAGHGDIADMVHKLHVKRERRNDMVLRALRDIQDNMKIDKSLVENLSAGFPGDDPRGHREAHEAWIQREMLNKELKKSIIDKSLVALIWAVLAFIAKSVWENVKNITPL